MSAKTITTTIDAKNKTLGRVASVAAKALIGKDTVEFAKNKVNDVLVVIDNASRLSIKESKKQNTKYARYSGYPGGLRYETMAEIIDKKGMREVLREAIEGMLPKNKLKVSRMKLLKIND